MKKILLFLAIFILSACMNDGANKDYDFSLKGSDKMYSLKDFKGENLLIYFGYTLCADVCPTSMAIAAEALKDLNRNDIKIIFISLDPQRDTPSDTTEFVQYFYPNSIALIPESDKMVEEITKKYGAKYGYIYQDTINNGKGLEDGKSPEKINVLSRYKSEPDDNYTVAHSSSFYIFDKDGNFKGEISNLTANNVKKKISEFLGDN